MNKTTQAAFVAVCVAVVGAFAFLPGCGDGGGGGGASGVNKEAIPWRTDLAAARAEAARTHRAILIDFSATWCGPCQEMKRTTFSDPAVAAALADKIPVSIDVDQHTDIATQFGVQSIPNLVVQDERGVTIKSSSGFMSSNEFIAWLNSK